MSVDLIKLKEMTNIVDVINRRVRLTKKGSEHLGICPFHVDEKESLQVNEKKQVFKCFACGEGGDSIDFLTKLGVEFKDAIKEIENGNPVSTSSAIPIAIKREKPEQWISVPTNDQPSEIVHYKHGTPSMKWPYFDRSGMLLGFAVRFDTGNGQKEVLPFMHLSNGKETKWIWKGLPAPRPLYNLDLLIANPNATVIVVEGEKTADAVQKHFDPRQTIVTTWMGGASSITNSDWSVLEGRSVIYWPDNDIDQKTPDGKTKPWFEQPGNKAMLTINTLFKSESSRWINNPKGLPHKWDAADRDWKKGEIQSFIDAQITTNFGPVEKEKTVSRLENPPLPPAKKQESQRQFPSDKFFRMLGFDIDESQKLVYYFFSFEARSVIRLSPSSITKPNLLMLAPINFWEQFFAGSGNSKINIDAVQQFLISASHAIGPFREKFIRGRGAWMDEGRLVIHQGLSLVVDGKKMKLSDLESKYVYQIGENLGFGTGRKLRSDEAKKIQTALSWLLWDRDISSHLLAGWCVIAPFCGVLNWRPHIWITGPSGSGKSWVMEHVLKKLLGETGIVVQGKTTEAGVRGMLQSDARPVLFDETDVETQHDKDRVQSVLSLARSASYSDGGVIGKGTQTGTSKTYTIRSCFGLSSIGVHTNQQSDRSRFTILGLSDFNDTPKKAEFPRFESKWMDLVTVEYVKALQSRTMSLMPIILKNARTFADAASHVINNRRIGDQIGSILAGAYSLVSSKEITYDNAVEWIREKEWDEEMGMAATKDEFQLLNIITQHVVRVEGSHGHWERNIGELVAIAKTVLIDDHVTYDMAEKRLRRSGIMTNGNKVFIANNHPAMKTIVSQTSWANNHNKILERLPGAERMDPRNFGPAMTSRSVSLPFSLFFEEKQPEDVQMKFVSDEDLPF